MVAVKKIEGPSKRVAKNVKERTSQPALSLPLQKKEVDRDIRKYTIVIYGREKIGKTTWCSTFPGALFLSTEPGVRGISVYSFNDENGGVTDWSIFRQAVHLLENDPTPRQFETVVIDTADRAYDMCMDWVCSQRGITHPGDEAYGKSWKAVKDEFTDQIYKLIQAGYGVVFVSHSKENLIEEKSGVKYTRIQPTMSGQAWGVVSALVDFIIYAEYAKNENGDLIRVLICHGDETITAGVRNTPSGTEFPPLIQMDRVKGYNIFKGAFEGKLVGVDPRKLLTAKSTTKTGSVFLKRKKGG